MPQGLHTKRIIVGFVLLIVIGVICYVWYEYDLLPHRLETSTSAKYTRQLKNGQKAKTKSITRTQETSTDTPVQDTIPDVERQVEQTIPTTKTTGEQSETHDPVTTTTVQTEETDVRMSPYGFGPFPKLPPGYPDGEDPNFWTYDWGKEGELMVRVSIKLWEQGIKTHGASMSNGLVYPVYPNTLIIKWETEETPFGTRRVARRVKGSPETEAFQRSHRGPLYENDIPSHFTVIDFKDAGIDPHKFLGLP